MEQQKRPTETMSQAELSKMKSIDSLQTTFSNTASTTTPSGANTTLNAAGEVAAALVSENEEQTIHNQKLVEEFQYLLEKSQSLFSGLRDLPPTGSHRQWRPYFEKTFEVYTKLWKFQQTHRHILEDKANYGLKRWEVGEIASKIGQLYYHYYLRTSETTYLHEAYVFYEAIHDRQYFKDILEGKNSALMIKKMRFYARFIIVCLLLNKNGNVQKLISELEVLTEEYVKTFKPPDAKEWQMVLEEVSTFTEAEKKLIPINLDKTPDKIEHRLSHTIEERPGEKLRLQEAILVGSYQKQIKFSELTLDMYRMLQSLEREPVFLPDKTKRPNPHKYLLHRPSLSQLLVYISAAFKDTSDHSALLLYMSADGCGYVEQMPPGFDGGVKTSQRHKVDARNYSSNAASHPQGLATTTPVSNIAPGGGSANTITAGTGTLINNIPATATNTTGSVHNANSGIIGSGAGTITSVSSVAPSSVTMAAGPSTVTGSTTSAIPSGTAASAAGGGGTMSTIVKHTEVSIPSVHCLHPADLAPFTRKPMFLIIDSDHSTGFKTMPNIFDQPLMCLMSPEEYPSSVQDKSEIGSLFTLFLHTPLLGFCSVSDIGNLDQQKWDECVQKVSVMENRIGQLLLADVTVDRSIKRFMTDDFLYYFIVRFVLCGIILRYHSSFKDEKSFPTSTPNLPESIYVSSEIVTLLADLTRIADVGTYFSLPAYATTVDMISSTSTTTNHTTNNGNNSSAMEII
ncbi:hypothetical protein G6F46_003884 [Rhizopus delemar]|uniref:Protein SCAI n=2 Tax=Rhizopus TaxID=4842 RepID=A0A9P6Z8T7_9FUNG|nr:hypothetical protein G6F55_003109 [Rhizopus delemar]KAG1547122.1 hypothetical protein G6F51_004460 [Rhizopus arrhizus]KAG1500600.1 hypothetical protein G6F54_003606 [Rhizopus delemar]KAG1512510.1 hypothetical protein G6F53_005131 [Rhizopus delemar]KAG1525926.1 hypothetical protein G6F52_002895 [Rhizopus delemar]